VYPRPVNRPRLVAAALLLLLAGSGAAAEPPPGGIPDLVGPRSLALGASIGIASSNDGIFVNAASMAARKAYSIEALFYDDRRGSSDVGQYYGASVVDSVTAPVTGGVAYTRAGKGAYTGNLFDMALAGPVAEKLYLGVTGKWYSVHGPTDVGVATADASLFWEAADYLSIGAAGYNLVPVSRDAVAPLGAGVGISVGTDQLAHVTGEWRAQFPSGKTLNRYAVGAEVLVANMVPLRAGWTKDEVLRTSWWSAGGGVIVRQGVALDVGYRQSFDASSARTFALSLKVFFLQ